jgi:hypothetical protein
MTEKHEPTKELRHYVQEQIAYNASTHEQIWLHLGISKTTFYKYYKEEADNSKPILICEAANVLRKQLRSENEKIQQTAAMFILKTQGGWRETDNKELQDMNKAVLEVTREMAELREKYVREY